MTFSDRRTQLQACLGEARAAAPDCERSPELGGTWELPRLQGALASLGEFALTCEATDEFLAEACRLVGHAVNVDVAAVLQLQEPGRTLCLRAGIGWQPDVVGEATFKATAHSAEAAALATGQPTCITDTDAQPGLSASPLLALHSVRAVANAVIGRDGQPPFGLLQVGSHDPRLFTVHETAFLRGFASLVAAALGRLRVMGEMRDREQQLDLSLDAGMLGRWELDLASGAARGTARTMQIFGCSGHPSGWTYEHLLNQVVPEDRSGVVAALRAAADTGGDWHFQCRVRRQKNGQINWVEARGRTRSSRGETLPTHLLGLVADFTAAKSAEIALQRSNEALAAKLAERTRQLAATNAQLLARIEQHEQMENSVRRSHKMEAVGQIAEAMAHEFNNVLTGISGSLELIRIRAEQGRAADLGRYVDAALDASTRGAALTHRLLAFSQRQAPAQRAVDLNHWVASIAPLMRHRSTPAVHVRVQLADLPTPAWCDPIQLEAAALDLIGATCEAMPDGGTVTVATAAATMPDGCDDCVALSVTDDGPMERAALPTGMADAFSRAGGDLRVHSAGDVGTTAMVYLPAHYAPRLRVEVAPSPPSGSVVLVVEDEPAVRMVVSEVLTDLGYTVMQARDGRSALGLAAQARRLDLLITDLGLPGEMNGRHLATVARQQRPGLKVLLITGYAPTQSMGDSVQVMAKPFAMDALANRVLEMISG